MFKFIFITAFILLLNLGTKAQVQLNWESSFEKADSISKATQKPMLVFFSGSDWCKPCIKLKKYILETDEFAKYSNKFVLYNADFPYHTKQDKRLKKSNELLAERFNKEGQFPKVVFLDSNEKELGTLGFIDCSPKEYILKIETIIP